MGLSVMKKKEEDDGLLRDGRIIKSLKGEQIGSEYSLLSGPLKSTVRVYKDMPDVHELRVPGRPTRRVTRQELKDYISSGAYAEDSSVPELMRKSNISASQKEDVKKIQNK